jgi:hypothetical protein
VEAWHTLVHVCRKWRIIVFGSPRRLDLRLQCNAATPVKKMLDIWPPLPIFIWRKYEREPWGMDEILAALEHNDRICGINLIAIPRLQFKELWTAMQQPFPALTYLTLGAEFGSDALVDPDYFLGGSAPLLRTLALTEMPFPGLPKLLLSATHLVELRLWEISDFGYISPEVMATCLSMLTSLEKLDIKFDRGLRRNYESRHPPPPTRALLPVLTNLNFTGYDEYLEDLVARVDAPLLENLGINFFHEMQFDTPQFSQFISRTPMFFTHNIARVSFSYWGVSIVLPQICNGAFGLEITYLQEYQQLSYMARVCSSFPHAFMHTVKRLYILEHKAQPSYHNIHWPDDIETSQWLELLRPFNAVKDLYLSREFTPRIAPALRELVGERVTEALPTLQSLFLEEPLPSGPAPEVFIGQFFAARQLSSHPISVSRWVRD